MSGKISEVMLTRQQVHNVINDLEVIRALDKKDGFSKKEVGLANEALKEVGIRRAWMKKPFGQGALVQLLTKLKATNAILKKKEDAEICKTVSKRIKRPQEPIPQILDMFQDDSKDSISKTTTCETITHSVLLMINTSDEYSFQSKVVTQD